MNKATSIVCITASMILPPSVSQAGADEDGDAAIDTLVDVFDFVPYQGGNIFPEQIPRQDWPRYQLIDTRRAVDFSASHIPGAVNIEWRQLLSRRDELSDDKPVLLYCNTGSLSAQAALALRVAGREDVYILTGGFDAWNAKGRFDAHDLAAGNRSP